MEIEVLKVWLPSIVSIITLLINLCFYIFVQPRLGYKYKVKEQLYRECTELFVFLTDIVSKADFNGVPTKIREHSLKIHLCFVNGKADDKTSEKLEEIYQMTKNRKTLNADTEIEAWNIQFRKKSRELRKLLGRYCGGLREKKFWINH